MQYNTSSVKCLHTLLKYVFSFDICHCVVLVLQFCVSCLYSYFIWRFSACFAGFVPYRSSLSRRFEFNQWLLTSKWTKLFHLLCEILFSNNFILTMELLRKSEIYTMAIILSIFLKVIKGKLRIFILLIINILYQI